MGVLAGLDVDDNVVGIVIIGDDVHIAGAVPVVVVHRGRAGCGRHLDVGAAVIGTRRSCRSEREG